MTVPLIVCQFSLLLKILFAVSTANCKSPNGKRTQYSLVGRVFLKTSNICGYPYPKVQLPVLYNAHMHPLPPCYHQNEKISKHEIVAPLSCLSWNTAV